MVRHFSRNWAIYYFGIFALAILGSMFAMAKARADDASVHGAQGHDWYTNAQVTERSRPRLATLDFRWTNCCNKSEVVRTQFRSSKQKDADGNWHDEWWYLHPATNEWRQISNDIIHDANDNAPDGKPTLFVYNGSEVCFYLPREEGG